MKIELSEEDAAQVRAILLTHAEMQDRSALENEQLRGRLNQEETDDPSDVAETVNDLRGIHDDLTEDCDNLKRIADLFK